MKRKRWRPGMLIGAAGAIALGLALAGSKAAANSAKSAAEPKDTVVQGSDPIRAEQVSVGDNQLLNAAADRNNWLLDGMNYSNQRFSPLDMIFAGNVASLHPVAIVQTGMTASFETTPVVVNGVMFLTTPMVNNEQKIMALNAATGESIWTYTHHDGLTKFCCGPVNRGVATAYGNVYVATLDAKLLALDATSGKLVWSRTVARAALGYSETMAPQVYKDMVIVGSSGGEWPLRGFVAAYNAKSGKEMWRWWTTKPTPEAWEGNSWKIGGGAVWTTPAIDPKQDLVIFAVGNPNPDLWGDSRKGNNLYTDSIVALHARTGKLAWYYQEVPHDVWDYDAVSNVVLFDVRAPDGSSIPAAGEAGKTAWFYIVDRRNGRLIQKSEAFNMQRNMFAPPTEKGVDSLPGANGGSEWSPPAYSPLTRMAYILGMDQLMTFKKHYSDIQPGGPLKLGSAFYNTRREPGIQDGTFTAIATDTGKIAWQYKAPQPMIGGALATGGNLVFVGEGNGYLDCFQADTGKMLWRYYLGAGVNAPPVTYAVNGKQYVAVGAGGNFQLGYPYGDVVAIFSTSTP